MKTILAASLGLCISTCCAMDYQTPPAQNRTFTKIQFQSRRFALQLAQNGIAPSKEKTDYITYAETLQKQLAEIPKYDSPNVTSNRNIRLCTKIMPPMSLIKRDEIDYLCDFDDFGDFNNFDNHEDWINFSDSALINQYLAHTLVINDTHINEINHINPEILKMDENLLRNHFNIVYLRLIHLLLSPKEGDILVPIQDGIFGSSLNYAAYDFHFLDINNMKKFVRENAYQLNYYWSSGQIIAYTILVLSHEKFNEFTFIIPNIYSDRLGEGLYSNCCVTKYVIAKLEEILLFTENKALEPDQPALNSMSFDHIKDLIIELFHTHKLDNNAVHQLLTNNQDANIIAEH